MMLILITENKIPVEFAKIDLSQIIKIKRFFCNCNQVLSLLASPIEKRGYLIHVTVENKTLNSILSHILQHSLVCAWHLDRIFIIIKTFKEAFSPSSKKNNLFIITDSHTAIIPKRKQKSTRKGGK